MLCDLPRSNGRIAWAVAAAACCAMLALPVPAHAQRDDLNRRGPNPSGAAGAKTTRVPFGSNTDIIALRDAIMAQERGARMPSPDTAPTGDIVCIAGCTSAPDRIVYRSQPQPVVAKATAPVLALIERSAVAASPAGQDGPGITCIAGCYDPPAARTVASLRAQFATAAPQAIPRPKPPAMPIASAPTDAASGQRPASSAAITEAAPAPVKLRTGFRPTARSRLAQRLKNRAKLTARPEYGKVIAVKSAATRPAEQTAKADPSSQPEAAPQAEPQSTTPPVSTFAPTRKPERRKAATIKPVATVSTDWFNKLKREQEAAKQQAQ